MINNNEDDRSQSFSLKNLVNTTVTKKNKYDDSIDASKQTQCKIQCASNERVPEATKNRKGLVANFNLNSRIIIF